MLLSFNELESRVLKAVRGGGLAWGLAEEAAAAAAWLARADLLCCRPLVARLETRNTGQPEVNGQVIRPTGPDLTLCPILTGAWIADQGPTPRRLEIRSCLAPLWLAAVVARALPTDCKMVAEWPDVQLVLGRDGLLAPTDGDRLGLSRQGATSVAISIQGGSASLRSIPPASQAGLTINDEELQALQVLEQKTYVPASAHSRIAGAGAGLLDQD